MKFSVLLAIAACSLGSSTPLETHLFENRQQSSTTVNLGYSTYQGYTNTTTGLNIWKGIRFAAPPTGTLRWQLPQPPLNTSGVLQATTVGNQCMQAGPNVGAGPVPQSNVPPQSEDCLFLNVYAPPNAKSLPILVYIHGGGYGFGNGDQDLSNIIAANNDSFIGVVIQYRLGAFGFLSSDEVYRFGAANAGIRDQYFALEWVQKYISLFGGDPKQVTISGESAGGGSVMLHAMAYGGKNGTALFSNAIAASPYLPMQYKYNDWVPSQAYYAFAVKAGCFSGYAVGSPAVATTIFQCLVNKDITTLQTANLYVSTSGNYGTWGFLPVTDGTLVQKRPSVQLLHKQVNGLRVLSGNNAEEGTLFVPQNITTEALLVSWLESTFPLFTTSDIAKILDTYPSSNASDSVNATKYATLGDAGPTAVNQSALAVGQQQRANNIYAETTFVCPSYWLADAFPTSYKYQYSIPVAYHSADVTGYFGPASPSQSPEFEKAFQQIWGSFITTGIPTIPATANSAPNSTTTFPPYTSASPNMLNLNETGGTTVEAVQFAFETTPIVGGEVEEPGLKNDFRVVDANSWEGGRGARCEFWRSVGKIVPE